MQQLNKLLSRPVIRLSEQHNCTEGFRCLEHQHKLLGIWRKDKRDVGQNDLHSLQVSIWSFYQINLSCVRNSDCLPVLTQGLFWVVYPTQTWFQKTHGGDRRKTKRGFFGSASKYCWFRPALWIIKIECDIPAQIQVLASWARALIGKAWIALDETIQSGIPLDKC